MAGGPNETITVQIRGRQGHMTYAAQEPKNISPSSTAPWPTSKTANELVCFILHFMM